jgi:hypothetical protein
MTGRHLRTPYALAIGVLIIACCSCSIAPEGTPREIPVRDRRDLSSNFDQAAGAATGTGRIYLLSPEVIGQPRKLQSVARNSGDTPLEAMRSLFDGPNDDELQAQLRSAIPPGTRLLDAIQDGSNLVVNVSSELQQLTGEALVDGVAQIVLTASAITGVSSVTIAVDGVPQQWPSASGALQSEPLTRYDFPNLVVSSQPAFPTVPSPSSGT